MIFILLPAFALADDYEYLYSSGRVVQIIDVSSDGYVAPEPVDVSIPDVNIESMEESTFSPEPIQIDSGSD